jgi:hypothetical protein
MLHKLPGHTLYAGVNEVRHKKTLVLGLVTELGGVKLTP